MQSSRTPIARRVWSGNCSPSRAPDPAAAGAQIDDAVGTADADAPARRREDRRSNVEHGRDLWLVKADLNQFEQVVVNLVVNARDAMPEGGRSRCAPPTSRRANARLSRAAAPAEYVLVEVEDSGVGIPAELIEKISSRSSPPRKSARAPVSACPWSTASSSRPAALSSRFRRRQGTTFRIFLPRPFRAGW